MFSGLFAGITWALGTVILGVALNAMPFISTEKALFLAPFVSTFLHDFFSALFMIIMNLIKRKLKDMFSVLKMPEFKWLILASLIGGPIGMTGYVLTLNNLGSAIGAVASALYPAIGAFLAWIFLKDKLKWYQWIFLAITLFGVFGLGYSPILNVKNFLLGIIGVLMCAFGWGIEAVVLSKCFKKSNIRNEYALTIRQTVSALCYGLFIIPIVGGWGLTIELFSIEYYHEVLTIALAALCSTVSYLFYYRAISRIGAPKAMSLNITYTAWAILFTIIITRDISVLNPLTLFFSAIIVFCGIFTAVDFNNIFKKKNFDDKE